MRLLGCQRELGLIGEFEVVAAGMTADDSALLQGDDDLWVEVPVALGEGAWSAGAAVTITWPASTLGRAVTSWTWQRWRPAGTPLPKVPRWSTQTCERTICC